VIKRKWSCFNSSLSSFWVLNPVACLQLPQNNRYTESSALTFRSGVELGQEEDMENLPSKTVDGDLDVDVAELSLGQRLAALSVPDDTFGRNTTSSSSESEDHSQPLEPSAKRRRDKSFDVPANSLTRTLIQALHSSDSRLLEMCLVHSDHNLIRNTVRRLPPQLAVPLITGCVERLGRGARGNNMKGRGGGASSQRGAALIGWITVVLAVHSGHLMTVRYVSATQAITDSSCIDA
jgi:U3 small nucleolar RNA-associated protein 5